MIGPQGELLGLLLRSDLFDWLWAGHRRSRWRQLRQGRHPCAASLMRKTEICVAKTMPLGELLATLAQHRLAFIPVCAARTDVIRTLLALR